ncbi:MAG TPA: Imm5 family immunity protein [Pseudobacteroides sp.]|nr:Imm5 family immunity protein [Pseudobacteroides sp.]
MNKELFQLIEYAKNELNNNAKGELTLSIRRKIYKLMGEYKRDSEKHALISDGFIRRLKLARLSVEYVLHIWEEAAPEDKTPIELLNSIDLYIDGKIDWDSLWSMKNSFWTVVENYSVEDRFLVAAYVGFASIKATSTALFDENEEIEVDDEGNELLDEDLDPYTWDTAFYSSLAYSEYNSESEDAAIEKKREFWRWYLNVAVPTAYEIVKDK